MPPRIDAKILGEYPYPLARSYYRAYKATRDENQIHDFLMDLYEGIVKYLATLVLSQYTCDGAPDATINEQLQAIERPSLGNWVGWLRDIINYYGRQKKPLTVAEISAFYNEKFREGAALLTGYNGLKKILFEQLNRGDNKQVQTVMPREFFDLLLQYRNVQAHGAKRTSCDRERVVELLSPAMEELLDHMAFLTRYRLVSIGDVKRAPTRVRRYEHFVTDLTGNYPSSPRDPYDRDNDNVLPGQVYISAADQEYDPILCLHPFLIYRICPKCRTEQTFVLNEGKEKNLSYLSYQCGDQFSPTEYVDDLKAVMETLHLAADSSISTTVAERQVSEQRSEDVSETSSPAMPDDASRPEPVAPPIMQQTLPPPPAPQPRPSQPPTQVPTTTPTYQPPLPPSNQPAANLQTSQVGTNQPANQPLTNQPPSQPPQQQPPAPSQIACWRCAMLNGVDREFCFNCGASLRNPVPQFTPPPQQGPNPSQQVCPRCGTLNRTDRKFCTNCGQHLAGVVQPQPISNTVAPVAPVAGVVRCARCGTMNAPNKRFCTSCGNRLA
jgi:hypothetical protein